MTTLLVGFGLLVAAWLAAFLPYRLREPGTRARPALVALRTGTLFLLALLLWNPSLPREGGADVPGGAPWVVVDGSLGMEARGAEGISAWERAVERALEEGARLAVYDGTLRPLEPGELEDLEPGESNTRLAPAVEGVLEAGAARAELISDFRMEDGNRLAELAALSPEGLGVRAVGDTVRNAGMAAFEVPGRAETGEALPVDLHLRGEGIGEGDSVTVQVEEAGETLVEERLPAPPEEGTTSHSLTLPPFEEEGLRRLEAGVALEGDGFPHDDRRVGYVSVEEERRGVVLVALEPGWEGRQLLPVLERATDLEGEGFLRLGERGYLSIRTGDPALAPRAPGARQPGGLVDPETVARRLEQARIAVILGLSGDPPAEVRGALEEASGLLVFPGEAGAAELLGLAVDGERPGEWSVAPDLPASRLAGELTGVDFSGLPPVEGVLDVEVPEAGQEALTLERGDGGGPRLPGMLLEAREERRRVVVSGHGFWRWAARGGEAREAYRRLWSAVAGELLRAGEPGDPVAGPEERVVSRSSAISWRAEGATGREVRLEVRPGEPAPAGEEAGPVRESAEQAVVDTALTADDEGRFTTPPLPPGPYRYAISAADGEALGAGPFDVDPYAPDLERLPRPPDPQVAEGVPPREEGAPEEAAAALGESIEGERAGLPLRTHPLPYLLALALLCAEWVVRRRVGLR